MARTLAASRCALHDEAIGVIRDTLTEIKVQAEAHSVGLAQLVAERQKQNGRLERVETRVWWLIAGAIGLGVGTGLVKGIDIVQAAIGK